VVSERLGHSTTSFTLDKYAHVLPGMQAEAADLVAGLVLRVSSQPREWRGEDLNLRPSGYETYFDRLLRHAQIISVVLNQPLNWTFIAGSTLTRSEASNSKT